MKRLDFQCVIFFLCLQVMLPSPAQTNNPVAQKNIDVRSYDLSIRFHPARKAFEGNVGIHARSFAPISEMTLHASQRTLQIDSIRFRHVPVAYRREHDRLVLTFGKPLKLEADTLAPVVIYFRGSAIYNGAYDGGGVMITPAGTSYHIGTLSQPNFARAWWPCNDVPSDKATMTMAITVPRPMIAASNGLLSSTTSDDSTSTFVWKTHYPIATYLVSIAAAEYHEIKDLYTGLDGTTMPISYYLYPDLAEKGKEDFKNTKSALAFFASKFGEYPFIKEKFAYVVVDGEMTMEHQTLCSVQQSLITGERKHELTFVHEAAHHWFGNLVTPANWTQTWLSEGLATYAEALWLEHTRGREVYQQYIDNMMKAKPGEYAGSVVGKSDTAFWDSFASRVYSKGAIVCHMLRNLLGDTSFFAALNEFLAAHRYGNVTTEDLLSVCSKRYGSDLRWFFNQWVYASADSIDRPEVRYSWTSQLSGSSYNLNLTLEQTTSSAILYRLPMSIDITSRSGTKSFPIVDSLATQEFSFTLQDEPLNVEVDRDHTVFMTRVRKDDH